MFAKSFPQLLRFRGFGGSGISMKSSLPGVAPSTRAIISALCCRTTGHILEPRTTKASFLPLSFCWYTMF